MSLADFKNKVAEQIRDMWQARALLESSDTIQRVVIVALVKEYPQAFQTLLRVCGIEDIKRPFLSGYARIEANGSITCDLIDDAYELRGCKPARMVVFCNENEFIYHTRKLADKLKLDDKDRTEMFTVLQKWVASDKRVGVHGERLAS